MHLFGAVFDDPRIEQGIALFNEASFYECHDVLEDYWAELTGPEKPFFQGLIQAAVALFHFQEGNLGGARRMSSSCRVYLSPFAPVTAGIQVAELLDDMGRCFEELSRPWTAYPDHVRLDPDLIPKIRRTRP